jgi:flagellar basal-body rod protein FlgF
MDRMIYIASSGAKHILEQQANVTNDLANVSTTGFKAQLDSFRAVPVLGDGQPTRSFVVDSTVGTDFSSGSIEQTGRDLDVAVQGNGWLAVQAADGSEGYTREGDLKVSENGILQTQTGLNVLGDGGPISIPPDVKISIAKDGTISAVATNTTPATVTAVGQLKLVNPPSPSLVRGQDGLFRLNTGQPADADPNVTVVGGALESSNVNVVDAMVNMISLSRQFEMNMNLLKNAESNEDKAGQLLALG